METVFCRQLETVSQSLLRSSLLTPPPPSPLPLPSLDVLLEIDIPECQRDQQYLELRLGRGERQQQSEDIVHAVDSRISTSRRLQGVVKAHPGSVSMMILRGAILGGNCCCFEKRGSQVWW